MAKLAACLLNISEGRQSAIIDLIARGAISNVASEPDHNFLSDCVVLNVFSDRIYNRSVISIAGTLEGLTKGVISASRIALDLIDLRTHEGGHPRKGAIDLIPIHPVSPCTSLPECGQTAQKIGAKLKESHPDLEVFYFGHADSLALRDLVQRRKELLWFKESDQTLTKAGLTGIGAVPYMSNFNVMLKTSDIEKSRIIAASLRDRNGGLLGVQSMAFPHEGNRVEVACNVDLIKYDECNERHQNAKENGTFVHSIGDYYITPFSEILKQIQDSASAMSIHIEEQSKIIGFTPNEVGEITESALRSGNSWMVGKLSKQAQM